MIAVTGSVGKTSTKDLIAALIAPHRTVAASRANFNTEIGLPLELLAAPPGTEVLVLELAMRGFGQIAELTAICEPDVGVITNVGPVHLEQMESLEGVARAKAELLVGMRDGAVAVVPSDEPLLEPYLREELEVVTFGPGRRRPLRGRVAARRPGAGRRPGAPRGRRGRGAATSSSCRSTRATTCSTRSPPSPRRGRSACGRRGASTCASARCAASASRSHAAQPSSTTATTPTRCRCALPWTTSRCRTPPDGASRCSETCSSSGRPSASTTPRSAPTRRRRASSC